MPSLDPGDLTRHVDRLYRAAWAMCGSREDAEDLVQETFARVLVRPRRIQSGHELAYLMRTLRNTFINTRRTLARRPMTVASLEDVEPADRRTHGDPASALEVQELYAAIAALSDDFRAAIVSIDVMGLSYREAAHALGVKEATLTTRLHRARARIARELLHEPASPEPAERRVRDSGATGTSSARSAALLAREEFGSEGVPEDRKEL